MEQKKIGSFLKVLRNEKQMTQEQLAEQFGVSARTVSRWETGSNMPDLSILIELSDFYGVDVRDILKGERKSEMNEEKERLRMVAEYAEMEKQKLRKEMTGFSVVSVLLLSFYILLCYYQGWGMEPWCYSFLQGMAVGLVLVFQVVNMLYLMEIWPKLMAKIHGSSV